MRDTMPKSPGKSTGSSTSNGNPPGMNITLGGDAFLPPICVNKLDSGDNASEEDEVDDGPDMPPPSEVPRKLRRTKHKHHHPSHNRCTNKSSMSDSFVLPLIGFGGGGSPPGSGAAPGKRDPRWRENRAATHPDRKNEMRRGGIPISKSCPILGRHRYNAVDYDDDFESDDEDSDTDTDFKSMSFNVGSSGATKMTRSRLKDKNFNLTAHHDEMTSGVLCKLAKLESPRRVDSVDQLLQNSSSTNTTSSSCGTKLPNIFKTKSESNDQKVDHIARKSLLEKYENVSTSEQLATNTRTRTKPATGPTAKRLPESPRLLDSRATTWKVGSSSSSATSSSSSVSSSGKTLVSSPRLLASQGGDLPQDDLPTETHVPPGAAKNPKSRRKYKKRHEKSVEPSKNADTDAVDADGELSESATSDNKCRQWLHESEEKGSAQKSSLEQQK